MSNLGLGTQWAGYVRPDGRVGTRNWLAVVGIDGLVVPLVQRLAGQLPQSIAIYTWFGRGQVGEDETVSLRALSGLACNPNIGAALVIAADRPAAERFAHVVDRCGLPVMALSLQDAGEDSLLATHQGMNIARELLDLVTNQRRETVELANLSVGVECGHSDSTSGLVANPLAGRFVDAVVAAGGTALVGETYEWLGGEHILMRRAINDEVASDIAEAVRRSAERMQQSGRLWDNPGIENQLGGLTTIEEKALGAISKSGSGPIKGVLRYGHAPSEPGLYLMDTPFFTPESLTGFAAGGAQLTIMTTGVGNSFCSALAPTIKVTANPETAKRLPNQIDVDLSMVLGEPYDFDTGLRGLVRQVLAVASGQLSRGEVTGEHGLVLSRFGASV